MAKVTWLGEDELHGGGAGPSFTTAFDGVKFPKGEPVEVRIHAHVQKALNNQYFDVESPEDVDDAPGVPKRKPGRPSNAEKAAKVEPEQSKDPAPKEPVEPVV